MTKVAAWPVIGDSVDHFRRAGCNPAGHAGNYERRRLIARQSRFRALRYAVAMFERTQLFPSVRRGRKPSVKRCISLALPFDLVQGKQAGDIHLSQRVRWIRWAG